MLIRFHQGNGKRTGHLASKNKRECSEELSTLFFMDQILPANPALFKLTLTLKLTLVLNEYGDALMKIT